MKIIIGLLLGVMALSSLGLMVISVSEAQVYQPSSAGDYYSHHEMSERDFYDRYND